ncbi:MULTISPECIES: efflux RND transporter periplasmic adaptor subunit [unclassified Moraxella]|uniref:HlyD family secretion protein n=1 Tax=unclassified Moraxella TaxID=2685852 RepID=UPI003AF7741B
MSNSDTPNPTPNRLDEANIDALLTDKPTSDTTSATPPLLEKQRLEKPSEPPVSQSIDPQSAQPQQAVNKKSGLIRKIVLSLIILGLIGFVVWGLWQDKQTQKVAPISLQGHIEVQQTPIASKVAGRISKIHIKEGDVIQVGQKLIDMDSPEITARLEQAQAGKQMAQSQLDKAKHGARPQEVEMAKYQWQAAQSAADLAKVTYERINRLASEGLMSQQKRDEAYTNYIASRDKASMAKAQYDMAEVGARQEDIDTATAQVTQVDAKIKEAQVAQQEANLASPITGTVDNIIAKVGSVVGQGVPLLTVIDPNDQWVVLNVTENNLGHFAVGSQFTAQVPALSTASQSYQQVFKVYAVSVLSDFATWRPTNAQDGFDMRTFEVKARPTHSDGKLRQGMSVLVNLPATTANK